MGRFQEEDNQKTNNKFVTHLIDNPQAKIINWKTGFHKKSCKSNNKL